MSENELKTYYNAFLAAWKLFKKYATAEKMNWDQLIDEAGEIYKDSQNRLTKDIVIATVNELEVIDSESKTD